MNENKKSHWVDRITDQALRFLMLLMLFSQLIVGNTVDNTLFKTVFFGTVLVGWVVLGYVSLVKYKRDRKLNNKIPR